ncbi:hypothetical protein LguiA_016736 [Lonicera macranthoides]
MVGNKINSAHLGKENKSTTNSWVSFTRVLHLEICIPTIKGHHLLACEQILKKTSLVFFSLFDL